MSLVAGTRLGPYEIQSAIGVGGMGEVYKARDTRLDRTVAVKVLPPDVSGDPDRRARFEREAKTIASLNHPHICTLHDVGDHEGQMFLVMEHLAGQTLAERLEKGPLPLEQALTISTEIADALSAAHRQGVVHRDLKPANVMLTKGGAKLLDFGLAKLTGHGEQPAAAYAVSAVPTQAATLTGQGVIVGTLQYMAPEQLEGKPPDARTDLWALGAILYEMVTGKRAFAGTSAVSLMGAILERDPTPIASLQPLTPPALDRLVRRCLAKSPDERPDSAHDVASDLRWLRESDGTTIERRQPRRIVWLMLTLAVVSLVTVVAWTSLLPTKAPAVTSVYATIPLLTEQVGSVGQIGYVAISPDGKLLVFREGNRLVRRSLSSFATTPLYGTEEARDAVISPDGSALAFRVGTRIKRIQLSGAGAPAEVLVAPGFGQLDWGDDGQIYFSSGVGGGGICRVPAAGGTREAITQLDKGEGENSHSNPQLLPGGRAVLFTALGPSGGASDARVIVEVLATHERTVVAEKAIFGRYVESGHLLFGRDDGTVYAAPFDRGQLRATGGAAPVLSPVRVSTYGGTVFLWIARNGTLAFLAPTLRPESLFRIVDSRGGTVDTSSALNSLSVSKVGLVQGLRASPDGQRYLFSARSPGSGDVWAFDMRTGQPERLSFSPEEDEFPIWSPDGEAVAYTSAEPNGHRRIMIQTVGSAAAPKLVRMWPQHAHVTSWSSDGQRLTLDTTTATSGWDVWVIPLDGDGGTAVASGPGDERPSCFSPDGRWVAYQSNESGRSEVYVVSADGEGARRQVSTEGGAVPRWSPDGRTLYYLQNGSLVAQEVRLGVDFGKGAARSLFATPATDYDVLPGRRFVLTEPNPAPPDAPLHLITNWFEELKAKVPPAR